MKLGDWSVRARLTLWHVAIMGLLLTFFAASVFWFVRDNMYSQIDERLDQTLDVVVSTAWTEPETLRDIERHTRILIFRVVEDDWPIYMSRGWAAGDLDGAGDLPAQGRLTYESRLGGIYHLKERTLKVDGKTLRVAAAVQCELLHRTIERLGVALVAGVPFALALILGGGYFLSGRALRPVQLLTARAKAIREDNLSERLSVPHPHDELGQLAAVLNSAFERLEQSFGRLRRFTHDAAHELRTPLAVLRSVGEVGLERSRDPNDYREVIGSMLEEVDRLGSLVDGLLTLARAESGRFAAKVAPEDVADLARDVVECLLVLAEEKQQTLVFEGDEPVIAEVDRDTLRLALINLVANAIAYTPVGGRVVVRARKAEPGAETVLEVVDNGPGIAPEHHERIFERFYRVEDTRAEHPGGSGLGLAVAKWAAEVNRGRIELTSAPGQGCVFRLVLRAS